MKGAPSLRGFGDLGAAGAAGTVDGPFGLGDGVYQVLARSRYRLSLKVRTGYMDLVFTLSRDEQTGEDAMRVEGRVLQDGVWKPVNADDRVSIEYSIMEDRGTIRWSQDGERKSEQFWNGEDRDGWMVIQFGGGHNHYFVQDGARVVIPAADEERGSL